MNLKLVLRTYSALRQLTDDESVLLNTLWSLNDGERELLVESLSPSGKKSTTKKVATKPTKSKRATELSDTLRQRAAGKPTATTATTNDDPNEHCQKEFPGGLVCDEPADANVHHLQTATGYHPFVSGAPSAAGKSSPNGEDGSSTASSATVTETASAVGGSD